MPQRIKLLGATELDSLAGRTPINTWLADHQPHVVMSLMESFGSNMLALDEPGKNDLLGSLREPFRQDFVFKRFVSEGNGTAPSLAALFFHSPRENLSHSSAQSKALTDTPFSTYKQAGYRVIFISPGNMMWRNLVNYLPVQGSMRYMTRMPCWRCIRSRPRKLQTGGCPTNMPTDWLRRCSKRRNSRSLSVS